MSDNLQIQDTPLRRSAYVYIRQSSATQVLVNRESTQRQYQLTERAAQLGWSKTQIKVIDEDLAHTGSGLVTRHGFAQMIQEVALGQVGLILCLEASRTARNNVEWFAYGKSRCERYVDETGRVRKRVRLLPQEQWAVLIRDHHPGFIDWATFEMNQARMASNYHPAPEQAAGAVREGSALLQGLATCGRCGRHLRVYYQGKNSTPGYYCANNQALNGRGTWCLRVGGVRVDQAVVETFLEAISPAGLEAAITAQSLGEAEDQSALKQFRLQVERARYEAERAERRFRSVEPENRLVARTLETEWESQLQHQRTLEAELARKEQEQRLQLTDTQREQIRALGSDLKRVWDAPTTTARDRKELLRSLLEEVKINVLTDEGKAHLVLCWKTSAVSELDVVWRVPRPAPIRTDEETLELMRRLAVHHPDTVIAAVLNRQGRQTARGESFTANRVASLRRHWNIPCFQAPATPLEGELLSVQAAADQLGVAASTLLRWLNDGFVGGEQVTPGAPWRIRMSNELKNLIAPEVPPGYVAMPQAMRLLGVSRQTIMQRVKRGDLSVVHVSRGKQKGLRIRVLDNQPQLFDQPSAARV
jgi:predicted site-specific integrase-resolvase